MSLASCHPAAEVPSRNDEVWRAVNSFVQWLEGHTYQGYDPYDVWGTGYGLWSRRLYYRNRLLGTPFIAPILLLEVLCPQVRGLVVGKQRFATADGQMVLAFLNLHAMGGKEFLEKAVALGRELEEYSIPGYQGHCWGYPFDWQHGKGMWRKNTPFITCTPYCFEAFLALHDVTGEASYLNLAASIAKFVHRDLRDTPTGANAAAGSYSPTDNSKVVNASAYRAMVLFEAARRFGNEEYRRTAEGNLNFILQSQREDGAWLYAIDEGASFIDHFHTCFVLKNLFKLNQHVNNAAVKSAIRRGYEYYRKALFSADGLPCMYSVRPRTQIVRLEMYDFAESITLGSLLRDEIPEAFSHAQKLARVLCEQYQLPDGHFATRVYVGGIKHTQPYLRWPQSQLFYSLTNLLVAGSRQ